MAQNIDEFIAELRSDVDRFEVAYKAKIESDPEHYPSSLDDGNEGMWFEFFMGFVTGGEV